MTKPILQHFIPRVYLKQFQIDNAQNKSFVYCINTNAQNPYFKGIRKVGLNDRIFKKKKYYNDSRLTNEYAIEEMFSTEIENNYDKVISGLALETNLSEETRFLILQWLIMSKMRSPILRENYKRIMTKIHEFDNRYKKIILNKVQNDELQNHISRTSKEIHLNFFSDKDQAGKLIELYIETLNAKQWRILKSIPNHPFITNDNPGFSPNVNPRFSKDTPFHSIMELNSHSFIFYIFSPDYCIQIFPFFEGTPLDVSAMNMDIKFEFASQELIEFINSGVVYTAYNSVISNSDSYLKNVIKTTLNKISIVKTEDHR